MNIIPLNLVFEDQISEFVMMKLVEKTNKFYIANSYSEGGFGYIKKNIQGFNDAAKGCPFFVLTDLDKTECAPTLIDNWFERPIHPNLIFRVAVREVETWLLSDIEGFSSYTGVSVSNFSQEPEKLGDPKSELMRIVRRSRRRQIKEDILPKDKYAKIGPNYNERLAEYVVNYWSINRAITRSDSLERVLRHLSAFKVIYK